MKYAFCLEMLYTELPFIERLAAAKKDGIDSFEIWDWRDKDLESLTAQMSALKMSLSNMSGNRQFGMIEPRERSAFLQELREAGGVAKGLDCPLLMVLVQPLLEDGSAKPVSPSLSNEEKTDQIIACGKEVGRLADALALEIVLEPLNSVLDHPGFYLNSSHLAFQIIREINHARINLLYDIYHMAMMEEDILNDIKDNLDVIGHFHIADKPGRHEPGSGDIDFAAVRSLLRSRGYHGVVGFEFTPSEGNSHFAVKRTLEEFC